MEIKIGDFTFTDEGKIIEVYDVEEHSVCWIDKKNLDDLINFLNEIKKSNGYLH